MKLFKVLSSTVLATAISVTTIQSAHATTQSTSSSSGQSDQTVLFDNSHAQTAGADWVIDGAFSDYADSMKNKGYNVKELDGEANISNETLKNAHILVIPEANNPFKEKNNKLLLTL